MTTRSCKAARCSLITSKLVLQQQIRTSYDLCYTLVISSSTCSISIESKKTKPLIEMYLLIGMLYTSAIIKDLSASVGEGQVRKHLSGSSSFPQAKITATDSASTEDLDQSDAALRLFRFAATLESLRGYQSTLSMHGESISVCSFCKPLPH